MSTRHHSSARVILGNAEVQATRIFPLHTKRERTDSLILGAGSARMSAYLQTLKETLADPSEALGLQKIDLGDDAVTINKPVKGHYPRKVQVSSSLLSMLNALPKTSEYIFATNYVSIARCYYLMRRKVSRKLNNPRILKISLVTFRHWGATMLYHQTRNILLVKKILGHKRIDNTMKYTQLIEFKDDEYEETTASTVEEARQLGKAGWVKYDEYNGIHLYRKPKRFVSLA